jgi:hypothetical protein
MIFSPPVSLSALIFPFTSLFPPLPYFPCFYFSSTCNNICAVISKSVFDLFTLISELQLKPHHKPHEICHKWRTLVTQYSTGSESRIERDEPVLSFQRNVFFSKRDEEKIKLVCFIKLYYFIYSWIFLQDVWLWLYSTILFCLIM